MLVVMFYSMLEEITSMAKLNLLEGLIRKKLDYHGGIRIWELQLFIDRGLNEN
jgi:hypothetical protein